MAAAPLLSTAAAAVTYAAALPEAHGSLTLSDVQKCLQGLRV